MADNFDSSISLTCSENLDDIFNDLDGNIDNVPYRSINLTCFDLDDIFNYLDGYGNVTDESVASSSLVHQVDNVQEDHQQVSIFNNNNNILMDFTILSEETVQEMVEREREHLPRDDYLNRFRSGDLDTNIRRNSLDWIFKASSRHSFEPMTVYQSINYYDRFLSVQKLNEVGETWDLEALPVACLSVASKLERNDRPFLKKLLESSPKNECTVKTIRKMEKQVLVTLKWRVQALTPFSFIHYFLVRYHQLSTSSFSRSADLILSTTKDIDFLEFKPSEIAAAVAIYVSGKTSQEVMNFDMTIIPSFTHVEKDRVLKCVELMKDWALMNGSIKKAKVTHTPASYVTQSPNDKELDDANLSHNGTTPLGPYPNSSETTK